MVKMKEDELITMRSQSILVIVAFGGIVTIKKCFLLQGVAGKSSKK